MIVSWYLRGGPLPETLEQRLLASPQVRRTARTLAWSAGAAGVATAAAWAVEYATWKAATGPEPPDDLTALRAVNRTALVATPVFGLVTLGLGVGAVVTLP